MFRRISHKVIPTVAAACIAVIGGFSYFMVTAQRRATWTEVVVALMQVFVQLRVFRWVIARMPVLGPALRPARTALAT